MRKTAEDESVESAQNFRGNRNAKRRRNASEESVWFPQEHTILTPKIVNLHGKNGHKWTSLPQPKGKTPARNLVLHLPGPKGKA
jgi:hypothetical protein